MTAGFIAFQNKTPYPFFKCVFQDAGHGGVKICPGTAGFQFIDLGGDAAGKKGKRCLFGFDQFQVMIQGRVKGFDADHAGTKCGQIIGFFRQNCVCNLDGKTT